MSAAAYPLWFTLAVGCSAVSRRMLMVAERVGLRSQGWLAAVCFGLWSTLATLFFWGLA